MVTTQSSLGSRLQKTCTRAFTFIEITVVIGIFAIMSAVAIFNFRDFGTNVSVLNLEQDLLLLLRQAQIYGSAAVGPDLVFSSGTSEIENAARRGLYMSFNPTINTYDSEMIIFADDNQGASSNQFVFDSGDSIVQRANLISQDQIIDICLGDVSSVNCWQAGGIDPGDLHITYTRPEPDALIVYDPPSGSSQAFDLLQIVVGDTDGVASRTIVVHSSGSLYVQ